MNPIDNIGNLIADTVSGLVAFQEVTSIIGNEAEKWAALAYLIAMRLAILEKEAWDSSPLMVPLEDEVNFPIKEIEERLGDIVGDLRGTSHILIKRRKHLICTKCGVRALCYSNKEL